MWTHIKPNRSLMLIEQWIYRTRENVPVCSLKRGDQLGFWEASILNHSGISTMMQYFVADGTEEAKEKSEIFIREKGWR